MSAINIAARQLVSQLKQLERRIRGEEQPTFAELHDLFDTMRTLDRSLDDAGPAARTPCALKDCPFEGSVEVIKGSGDKHCDFHAQQLRTLLGDRYAATPAPVSTAVV